MIMFRTRLKRFGLYAFLAAGVVFLGGLAVMSQTHQAFRIPTRAMQPALQVGDMLYARRAGNSFEAQQGDILIFKYPKDPALTYIKRCVAVAGDTVAVVNGILLVNNVAYESNFADPAGDHSCIPGWDGQGECPSPASYHNLNAYQRNSRNHNWPWAGVPTPYVVPAGHLFMMGDNRYNSMDSRYWGALDENLIIGKASFFYFSREDLGKIGRKVR
jgi:signal peptidase I